MNYLYRCVVPKPLLIKELAQGSKGNWKANSLACCKSAERAINAVPDVHQTEMLREDSQLFLRGRLLERQTVLLRALVCSRTRLVSATKVFWPAEYNKSPWKARFPTERWCRSGGVLPRQVSRTFWHQEKKKKQMQPKPVSQPPLIGLHWPGDRRLAPPKGHRHLR